MEGNGNMTYFTIVKWGKIQLPFTASALNQEGCSVFEAFLIRNQGIEGQKRFRVRAT